MSKLRLLLISLLLTSKLSCTAAYANDEKISVLLDKVEANLIINTKLSEKLLIQAFELTEESGEFEHSSRLMNLQAHISILKHDLNEAYAKAKEAEQAALKANNKLQLAEAIRKQGIVNFLLDFNADAIELLTKSLAIHEELNSKYVLNNLQAIGNVYKGRDAWAKSLVSLGEELVEKAAVLGNLYYEEEGYSFIISGLINQGNYEQANLQVSQVLSRAVNPDKDSFTIYYYAALAEFKLKNYTEALSYLDRKLESGKNALYPLRELSHKLLKAEILLEDNQYNNALPLLEQALLQANELQFSEYQEKALKQLSVYYEKTDNFPLALSYFRQYEALKETGYNTKQAERLAFSRARLELSQKNQKITELELSQQLNQQQNTYQLYFILLSCSIITLLLFMYWRSSHQKRILRQYSKELKQASEAKSDFLARMSHEIRTPINAIIGLTKLNQKSSLNDSQKEVNLEQIEESSITLLGVINDILDFSKIEAGHLQIEEAEFELDKVVNQSMRLLTLKAQKKDLELIEYIARDVPLLLVGDALRIQQVLNNLLCNAVKFTRNGVVSVSVNKKYSESGVLIEFAVKDTGIGIQQSHLETLFDPFTQADESTTRRFGGTGLGLSICKQLVELMGGKIWAESLIGQGSTFYFTVKTTEASVSDRDDSLSKEQVNALKVLLVDDVELSREAASNALFRLNITPEIAENGTQAISKVRQSIESDSPYQLIILDWKMPDIDGIEVASIITQSFPLCPPIIMLSAYDMDTLQELGKPLGIDVFLQKPIDNNSLLNAILKATNLTKDKTSKIVAPKSDGNAPKAPNLSQIKILLVEDNELNRKVAKGFLADTNADIEVAENGQIALQMLTEAPTRYELILMDIQMPVMDGLTVTRKIRNELLLTTPIIAMTAHAMTGDINKSLAAGMNAHITKPIDPDYLYKVLNEVLLTPNGHNKLNAIENIALPSEKAQLTQIDYVKAMQNLRLDEHSYWELVNDFIKLEGNIQHLATAIKENNTHHISKIIHLYSPSLSYIGANELADLASQILTSLNQTNASLNDNTMALITEFQLGVIEITNILKVKVQE
ncbi:response regulator [Paraglaciecola sp. 2405UD69-4]|uniref:tetratricopeptide repeat-containing hybrid sensor histidine kinase/response regulator n=1 Tax=Paraglaciecola sp. 2405UD69-4 TaxID=3391836 RepID=UPI0039C9ACB6